MRLEAGAIIADRFRLVRPLGNGGMGVVWAAHDLRLDSPCAVKLLRATIDEAARKRFALEARAAAQLRSPNVVQVLDHGEADGAPYIAMELLEGEDLASRLSRAGRLDTAKTLAIVEQIARALGRAHAAGLIHRDLKPANVFLVRDEEREIVKVLDFGIAKVYADDAPRSRSGAPARDLDASLTATGTAMGTPSFMSPEQIEGEDVDARSDVWALGVLTYQCLTGRLPFEGENLGKLYSAIMLGEAPAITTLMPRLPAAMDGWMSKALAKKRDDRFASARDLSQALERALGGSAASAMDDAEVEEASAPTERAPGGELVFAPTQMQTTTPLGSRHRPEQRRALLVVGALGVLAAGAAVYLALRPSASGGEDGLAHESAVASQPATAGVDTALPVASAAERARFVPGSSRIMEVATGANHTCARLESGGVACWGRGTEGQLGGEATSSSFPVMVPGIADAARLYATSASTCIVTKTGTVTCHGDAARDLVARPALREDVASLGLSPMQGLCAVKRSGRVVCSQSVSGKKDADGVISGIEDAQQVVVGQEHACALPRSGKVLCWGSNKAFQLAGEAGSGSEEPREVPGAEGIVQLSAARTFTCGRKTSGEVVCWGDPTYGALGAKDLRTVKERAGEMTVIESPRRLRAQPVLGVSGAADVAVAGYTACAVEATGTALCWGSNGHGMLGNGDFGAKPMEVGAVPAPPVEPMRGVAQVALGGEHACALLASGEVHCWGRNDERQLGADTRELCERGVTCSTRPVRAL